MEEAFTYIMSSAAKNEDVGWNIFDAIVSYFHPFMRENMSLEIAEWINRDGGGWGGLYERVKFRVKKENESK
jgi:hypothetical protein